MTVWGLFVLCSSSWHITQKLWLKFLINSECRKTSLFSQIPVIWKNRNEPGIQLLSVYCLKCISSHLTFRSIALIVYKHRLTRNFLLFFLIFFVFRLSLNHFHRISLVCNCLSSNTAEMQSFFASTGSVFFRNWFCVYGAPRTAIFLCVLCCWFFSPAFF